MSEAATASLQDVNRVGEKLRRERLRAGFAKLSDFAAAAGVPTSTYYCHERGTRKLNEAHARIYADVLGVSWQELLYDAPLQVIRTRRIGVPGWVGDRGEVVMVDTREVSRERDPDSYEDDPSVDSFPIMTDDLYPFCGNGDVVYFPRLDRQDLPPVADLHSLICVVHLDDDRRVIRKVFVSTSGEVTLVPVVWRADDEPITRAQVVAVAQILSVRKFVPKHLANRG